MINTRFSSACDAHMYKRLVNCVELFQGKVILKERLERKHQHCDSCHFRGRKSWKGAIEPLGAQPTVS